MSIILKQGDCLDLMKELPEESIDTIISDPPYQLTNISKRFGKPDSADAQYGLDGVFQRISKGFKGKEWDVLPTVEILKEALRVLKSGAFALWLMTPRQDSQLEFLLKLRQAGFIIGFTPLYWTYASGFPKGMNIAKTISKIQGAKKQSEKKHGRYTDNTITMGKFNSIYQDYELTDDAKKFNGSYAGFQPKPAVEVVVVSMKPLSEKTYTGQALKNGKGLTWLDNCRIPIQNENVSIHNAPTGTFADGDQNRRSYKNYRENNEGRLPANLLVSDNVLDVKSNKEDKSLSRFFSLDEWWRVHEQKIPEDQRKILPFMYVPRASKKERHKGIEDLMVNVHPTVKPVKLMSYLINLATREDDLVLDPFMGSGTTGLACLLENRHFIGFERDAEYFKIAQKRINYFSNLF